MKTYQIVREKIKHRKNSENSGYLQCGPLQFGVLGVLFATIVFRGKSFFLPPPPRVESTTGLLGKSNFKLALNRIHRNRKCRRMVHSQFVEEKTVRKISIFHSIYFEFAR